MNKWDSKRIAIISILIAMSISFVIIGTRFAALSSLPNIKLSLAGLPVKIIGYIFGPLIGFIIGITTDIISFVFMPSFYFPVYSFALGVSGMLPGVSAFFFSTFYKMFSRKRILKSLNKKKLYYFYLKNIAHSRNDLSLAKKYEKKYEKFLKKIDKINSWKHEKAQLNFLLISALVILTIVLIAVISIFIVIPQSVIDSTFMEKGILRLLSNKIIFIVIIVLGIAACMLTLIAYRKKVKNELNYLQYTSVVIFVVLTEFINIPIIAYADSKALKIDFITSMIASLGTSFIKIWFNLVIISFAIKIVVPLITKKTFNGYV